MPYINIGDFKTSDVDNVVLIVSDIEGNLLFDNSSFFYTQNVTTTLYEALISITKRFSLEDIPCQFIGGYKTSDKLYGLYFICLFLYK